MLIFIFEIKKNLCKGKKGAFYLLQNFCCLVKNWTSLYTLKTHWSKCLEDIRIGFNKGWGINYKPPSAWLSSGILSLDSIQLWVRTPVSRTVIYLRFNLRILDSQSYIHQPTLQLTKQSSVLRISKLCFSAAKGVDTSQSSF